MTICIIPARSGSKRLKNKNIKKFDGKPIISYAIKIAQSSGLFSKIIVSTDSKKISNIAMQLITSDSQPIVSELRKIHGLLNQNSSAKSVDAVIKVINE